VKRGLRRRIEWAINESWSSRQDDRRGGIAVLLGLPRDAKDMPALDDGEWTGEEVWTVTAPTEVMNAGDLYDKPHRITWMAREPAAEVHREPYAGHPAQAVDALGGSAGRG
jgi:hypothetical protein